MVNRPTTAAKSKNRSVSVSVALDGGQVGDPAGQCGHQSTEFRPVGRDVGDERCFGGEGDVVAQRFGEQLVGGGEVFFAVAEQHAGPIGERGRGPLRPPGSSCPDRPHPRPRGPRGPRRPPPV